MRKNGLPSIQHGKDKDKDDWHETVAACCTY